MFGLALTPRLLGWFGGVALLLAIVGGIFLAGRHAGVISAQRADDAKVATICEAAGATWQEVDANGKPLPRGKWGHACAEAARSLMKFKADALAASTKALADHAAEQTKKLIADQADAARRSDAASKARRDMEAANAAVKNDRVDGGWFAHLNQLGGLRDAPQAQPDRARSAAEGEPPF